MELAHLEMPEGRNHLALESLFVVANRVLILLVLDQHKPASGTSTDGDLAVLDRREQQPL